MPYKPPASQAPDLFNGATEWDGGDTFARLQNARAVASKIRLSRDRRGESSGPCAGALSWALVPLVRNKAHPPDRALPILYYHQIFLKSASPRMPCFLSLSHPYTPKNDQKKKNHEIVGNIIKSALQLKKKKELSTRTRCSTGPTTSLRNPSTCKRIPADDHDPQSCQDASSVVYLSPILAEWGAMVWGGSAARVRSAACTGLRSSGC